MVVILTHHFLDVLQIMFYPACAEAEHGFFDLFNNGTDLFPLVVCQLCHLVGRGQHTPPDRGLLHNLRVRLGVQAGGGLVDQRQKVSLPANLSQLPLLLQVFTHRENIDRHLPVMQAHKGSPDPLIADDVKILRVDHLGDLKIGIGIDQNRTKHSFFSLAAVGL